MSGDTTPRPDEVFYRRLDGYMKWVAEHVSGAGYGECKRTAKAMAEAFPLLEVRFGFLHSGLWGRRAHWWCREKDGRGQIVDPTARQFPDGRLFPTWMVVAYEDLTDLSEEALADKVPSGPCMNCGEDCYHGETFCCPACHDIVAAEMNAEMNAVHRPHQRSG